MCSCMCVCASVCVSVCVRVSKCACIYARASLSVSPGTLGSLQVRPKVSTCQENSQ